MKNNEKRFSVPYNNDFLGIKHLIKNYSRYIKEIYFPINPKIIGSGRAGTIDEYYDEYIKAIFKEAHENGIQMNMVVNPLGMVSKFSNEKEVKAIVDYISIFSNIYDLDYVTLTNPILAERINNEIKNVTMVASVNMFINTYSGIKMAEDLGFNEIYLDRDSNWDLELIKTVKNDFKNLKLRLMLNEGCLPNCIFRISHVECLSEINSYSTPETIDYSKKHMLSGCVSSYSKDSSLFLKTAFIRPEDTKYYEDYIDTFKVVGRTAATRINEIRLKAYIDEDYEGDIGILLDNPAIYNVNRSRKLGIENKDFPSDYIEKKFGCIKNCSKCNYCLELSKKIIKKTNTFFI